MPGESWAQPTAQPGVNLVESIRSGYLKTSAYYISGPECKVISVSVHVVNCELPRFPPLVSQGQMVD